MLVQALVKELKARSADRNLPKHEPKNMRNPKWHRDEIILALDLYFSENRGSVDARNPKVIELSETLNRLPIFDIKPDQEKFRNPNGVTLKLSNFLALDPSYPGKGMEAFSRLDKELFEEFSGKRQLLRKLAHEIKAVAMNPKLAAQVASVENDEVADQDSAREGQVLYKLHKVRERDKKIVKAKKQRVLKEKGKLECEVCEFDFEARYGEVGRGYIECHHIVPLAEFESSKETKLDDLALVCANCHRMLHRDISIKGIQEFKGRLKDLQHFA